MGLLGVSKASSLSFNEVELPWMLSLGPNIHTPQVMRQSFEKNRRRLKQEGRHPFSEISTHSRRGKGETNGWDLFNILGVTTWSDLLAARMILQAAPAVRVYCLGEKTTRNAFRLSPSRLRDDFRVLPFGSRCCRCDVAVFCCVGAGLQGKRG
ncbi:hypothetical protein KY290_029999 [Solanum tuberosum]|uniref:Uncharacterized protein n=1 Tax=Solanum tuberosum TaxID=4113 RepID=A0ABQ7UMB2_SOLTU|nr:hypothetical protein KY290_029999 [Solanum tuberosum]